MNLGGIVVSPSHVGRERRHAPTEDGRRWVEENGERHNGGGSFLSLLPKGALVAMVLVLSGGLGYAAKGWIDHVNQGMDRLGAVEVVAATTAADQQTLARAVSEFRGELVDMRADFLEQARWLALLEGDRARAKDIEAKLEAVKAGKP